jgi:hypothetical protein
MNTITPSGDANFWERPNRKAEPEMIEAAVNG